MSKLFNWAAARVVAAFALALPLAAMAVTPYAVWDGASTDNNFTQLTRGGYMLAQIGGDYQNTVAEDGSYLQIGSENAAAAITLKKSDGTNMGASTVIIKVENMPANGGANRAVLSFLKSENKTIVGGSTATVEFPFIGVAEEKNLTWTSSFIWDNAIWNNAANVRTENAFSSGKHTVALAYSYANGSAFYVDGVPRGASSSLKATGYSPLGVAIGGVADARTSNMFYAMTGMKITAIAFFGEKLSDEDVANYVFPSDADSVYSATVSSDKVWSEIEWNRTLPADLSEAVVKLTIETGATVTAPSSLVVGNLSVTGAGTLTFAEGENTLSGTALVGAKVTLASDVALKTSGVVGFTSDANTFAGNSLFEVVSGSTSLKAAEKGLSGNIKVDSGATLVNLRGSDALNFSATTAVDVYGTLSMESTRWTIGDNNTINVHGGSITGAGDGNGALDFINTGSLNVTATSTIDAKIRFRNAQTPVTVAQDATLTISSLANSNAGGGVEKKGAGTLKFTVNPTQLNSGIAVEAGALDFTGVSKVTTTVIYDEKPESGIDYLTASNWEGAFVVNWTNSTGALNLNLYGRTGSRVKLATDFTGGYIGNGGTSAADKTYTVLPALELAANMTLTSGWGTGTANSDLTTFTTLTGGSGKTMTLWGTGYTNYKTYYNIAEFDDFAGTLAVSTRAYVTVGTIKLAAAPAVDDKILNLSVDDGGTVDISNAMVKVGDEVQTVKLELRNDGVYVVEPKVTITVPAVANTTVTVKIDDETIGTAAGNYDVASNSVVTVTYAAADGYQISGLAVYTIDTSNNETTFELDESTKVEQVVARVRNYDTNQDDQYTTLAAAIAAADGITHANMIVLMADVTGEEVTVTSAILITGAHTISSDIKIVEGGQLQLMQVTLAGKLTIDENGIYATGGGTLNELVTKDGAKIQLTTLSDTAAPLAVTTLSVTGNLTIVSSWGSAVRDTYYKALSYVTANADIAEGANVDSVNEWSAKVEAEGDNTVVYLAITKVAVVDGMYYDDAQVAVDAAVASGKPVSFLVGPGTVELGAGETLVVSGATLPTVALDDGLTTPPYEIEHTVDGMALYNTYKVKAYVAQITRSEYSQELGPHNVTYKFESIADAVDNANAGETIKVIYSHTLTGETSVTNNNLTLDLNGFTVTGAAGDTPMFNLGEVSFTVADTSVGGTGKAVSAASKVILSASPCTFTLASGTLESGNNPIYLYNSNGDRIVNIHGGKLVCNYTGSEHAYAIVNVNGSVNVTAGEIESQCGGFEIDAVTFSGGSLMIGPGSEKQVFHRGSYSSTITVTGGTFNRDINEYCASGYAAYEYSTGIWTVSEVYVEGQDICLDGTNVTINASQAAWLKKCGDKTTVSNALENLAFEQFSDACLLNLNILAADYQHYEKGDFIVTDFHFETENETEYVVVGVSLERHGALGGINGTLKLMGTSLLGEAFVEKAVSDFTFINSDTTTLRYVKDGTTLFYKPVIE